jgi:hypothetical protein
MANIESEIALQIRQHSALKRYKPSPLFLNFEYTSALRILGDLADDPRAATALRTTESIEASRCEMQRVVATLYQQVTKTVGMTIDECLQQIKV